MDDEAAESTRESNQQIWNSNGEYLQQKANYILQGEEVRGEELESLI
jgi:hypothetical protein